MARITSQYGDVYFLATDASASRSWLERPIVYGLFLGIRDAVPLMQAYQNYILVSIIRHRIYE